MSRFSIRPVRTAQWLVAVGLLTVSPLAATTLGYSPPLDYSGKDIEFLLDATRSPVLEERESAIFYLGQLSTQTGHDVEPLDLATITDTLRQLAIKDREAKIRPMALTALAGFYRWGRVCREGNLSARCEDSLGIAPPTPQEDLAFLRTMLESDTRILSQIILDLVHDHRVNAMADDLVTYAQTSKHPEIRGESMLRLTQLRVLDAEALEPILLELLKSPDVSWQEEFRFLQALGLIGTEKSLRVLDQLEQQWREAGRHVLQIRHTRGMILARRPPPT